MTKPKAFLWPSVILLLAVLSFAIRSRLGIPILSGTWIRSVVLMEPFGFKVTGLGPWYDGSLGWPMLVAVAGILVSTVFLLCRDQTKPLAAYSVLALLVAASIPTWAFPLSLVVPLALLALPVMAVIVLIQLFSKEPRSYSLESKIRAAYAASLFFLMLAVWDWAMVFLVGGS